jgi:hypothetical protein
VQRTAAQGNGIMVNDTIQASHDWLANTRASALAWWIPQVAIIGGAPAKTFSRNQDPKPT